MKTQIAAAALTLAVHAAFFLALSTQLAWHL
jgi:hypothetical protein